MRPARSGPILFALALLTAPAAVAAAEVSIGKITIAAPDGWTLQRANDNLVLTREYPETADIEQASALIQILPLAASADRFDANFSEVVAGLPELAGEDPMLESAGTTSNGHTIRAEMRCCDHSRDVGIAQTVVGLASDQDQVFAALVVINTSSDHEQAIEAAFEALVRSIRFDGDGDGGLMPTDGDGGLEGVYTHLETGLTPNVFGGIDFTSDSETTIFDPAGLFSTVIPGDGMALAEYCQTVPTDCGTYRLKGGGFWFGGKSEIELRTVVDAYGTIETESLSFAHDGDDLLINDRNYYRLPPFDAGTTFDGTWTSTWASSGMMAMSSGSVASQRTLVLTSDGHYSRDGWSGGSTDSNAGGVTISSNAATSTGTYAVSGFQLTLTDKSGATETLSIFAPDRDSNDLLVINGQNYLKDD